MLRKNRKLYQKKVDNKWNNNKVKKPLNQINKTRLIMLYFIIMEEK